MALINHLACNVAFWSIFFRCSVLWQTLFWSHYNARNAAIREMMFEWWEEKRSETGREGEVPLRRCREPTALPLARQGLHFLPRAYVYSPSLSPKHPSSVESVRQSTSTLFVLSLKSKDICEWWRLIWHEMVFSENQITEGEYVMVDGDGENEVRHVTLHARSQNYSNDRRLRCECKQSDRYTVQFHE